MKKSFSLVLLSLIGMSISAQKSENLPFSRLNVAVGVSTLGYGIEAATPIHKNFDLRAGINFISYSSKDHSFSLTETDDNAFENAYGYVPDYNVDGKLNFINGDLLVDWHPMRGGIFHFTAGAYLGKNTVSADGFLVNPTTKAHAELLPGKEPPTIVVDDYVLTVTQDAALNAKLQLGKFVKPYFGLGLGNAVTKHRVGFKFELGLIYQGDLSVSQNGQKLNLKEANKQNTIKDLNTYTDLAKWWPMLNFQLTFRVL